MSLSEQEQNFTVDAPFSFNTYYYVLLDSVYGYISSPGTFDYSVVGDIGDLNDSYSGSIA